MKDKIKNAYDSVQPGKETYAEIWENVRAAAENKPPQRNPMSRKFFLVAACIAGFAALTLSGYAAIRKWTLPKPESYTPDAEDGVYSVHRTETYTQIPSDDPAQRPEDASLTDGYFLEKSAEVLALIGLDDVDKSRMTVARQEHLYWSREEVEVTFTEDENCTGVKFDAESGYLLGLSSIDWVSQPEGSACATHDEAVTLAEDYYRRLPVPQGYVYTGCTEYDEQYWSIEFCRMVEENLHNAYEMVRIGINPVSGRLTGVNVFYVPLLDDHEPEDEPLTQAQAEQIAAECSKANLNGRTLQSAEIQVVLPNWMFTDGAEDIVNAKASSVTRLGWCLIYENSDSLYADEVRIYVDLYTGEILGGDMT